MSDAEPWLPVLRAEEDMREGIAAAAGNHDIDVMLTAALFATIVEHFHYCIATWEYLDDIMRAHLIAIAKAYLAGIADE